MYAMAFIVAVICVCPNLFQNFISNFNGWIISHKSTLQTIHRIQLHCDTIIQLAVFHLMYRYQCLYFPNEPDFLCIWVYSKVIYYFWFRLRHTHAMWYSVINRCRHGQSHWRFQSVWQLCRESAQVEKRHNTETPWQLTISIVYFL